MDGGALRELAENMVSLAGLHHLALFAILVIVWMRRDAASRVLSIYFTAAFGTAAAVLLSHSGTRAQGVVSLALCALWIHEAARPRVRLVFARTPRLRLVAMALFGAFAISYPGYSGALPAFIFSPIGVILSPTLLAALALLNASTGETNRTLHWSLAVAGLMVSTAGLVTEGAAVAIPVVAGASPVSRWLASGSWVHLPLAACSLYAIPVLLGRGGMRPEQEASGPASVNEIRRRMYSRRSFLPGPRDPRRVDRRVKIRRR